MTNKKDLFRDVKLQNVRLSFPNLFRMTKGYEDQQDPHYSATFILDKNKHKNLAESIISIRNEIYKNANINNGKPNITYPVVKDGDTAIDKQGELICEKRPEYKNSFFISSKSFKPVFVYDKGLQPVNEETNIFYAGCYVNAVITLTGIEKWKCVSARLKAIQFFAEGEALINDNIDYKNEFEVIEESSESLFN